MVNGFWCWFSVGNVNSTRDRVGRPPPGQLGLGGSAGIAAQRSTVSERRAGSAPVMPFGGMNVAPLPPATCHQPPPPPPSATYPPPLGLYRPRVSSLLNLYPCNKQAKTDCGYSALDSQSACPDTTSTPIVFINAAHRSVAMGDFIRKLLP